MKIPFDYEQAVYRRNAVAVKYYKKQIDAIAGRFTLLQKTENEAVFGFVGSAFADSLNEIQLLHICGFANIDARTARFESRKAVTVECNLPLSNYHDFLIISFLPCTKCVDNWKREYGVCNDGFGVCKAFMDYISCKEEARG